MVLTITSAWCHTSCELQVHRLPDFSPCLLQIIMNDGVPFPSRQAGKTCSIGLSTNTAYECMYVCMCIHEKLGVGIKYLWVGLHCEVIVNKLRGRLELHNTTLMDRCHDRGKLADRLCWYSNYTSAPSDNCMHEQ